MDNSTLPAENQVVLALPDGVTISDLYSRVTVSIVCSVSSGILFWDHINFMRHELKAFFVSNCWKPWEVASFIILRYSGIAAMLSLLFLDVIPAMNFHCSTTLIISQASEVIAVSSACFIFTCGCGQFWHDNKKILGYLGVLSLGVTACWVVPPAFVHVGNAGSSIPFTSNCVMDPYINWLGVTYAASSAYDLFVLLCALDKYSEQRGMQCSLEFKLYRNFCLYLMVSCLANLAFLAVQLLGTEHDSVKTAIAPVSVLFNVAIGSRVAVNSISLRKFQRSRWRSNDVSHQLSQISSSISSFKVGRGSDVEVPVLSGSPPSSSHLKPTTDFDRGQRSSVSSLSSIQQAPSISRIPPSFTSMMNSAEMKEDQVSPESPSVITDSLSQSVPTSPTEIPTSPSTVHSPISPMAFAPPTPRMAAIASASKRTTTMFPEADSKDLERSAPLTKNQYTTFPSPPASAEPSLISFGNSSLNHPPIVGLSPKPFNFGNLARLKKGKDSGSIMDPKLSGWAV